VTGAASSADNFTLGMVGTDALGQSLSVVRPGTSFLLTRNSNDLVLVVVPEPSAAALTLVGLAFGGQWWSGAESGAGAGGELSGPGSEQAAFSVDSGGGRLSVGYWTADPPLPPTSMRPAMNILARYSLLVVALLVSGVSLGFFGPAAPPAGPSSEEALPPEAAALAIPSGTPPGCEPLSWSRCARRHEPPDLSPGDPAAPRGLAVPHAVTSGVGPRRRRSTRSRRSILRAGSSGVKPPSDPCRHTSRTNSAAILGAGSCASDSLVLAARAAARGSSWPSPARAAASARPATAATWPRRPRILSITSSRRCPCGSG
jgi:hypothetical protein